MPQSLPCGLKGCNECFTSESTRKQHWADEPDHEYCVKCDVMCEDFETMLHHLTTSEAHIVCPVCARQFGSEGGKEKHLKTTHQDVQMIVCPSCRCRKPGPGGFIAHLEKGLCHNRYDPQKSITKAEFLDRVNQKMILAKLLHQSNPCSINSLSSAHSSGPPRSPSTLHHSNSASSKHDTSQGGPAVDHVRAVNKDSQLTSKPALEPTRENTERTRHLGVAAFPALPSRPLVRSSTPTSNFANPVQSPTSVWNKPKAKEVRQPGISSSQKGPRDENPNAMLVSASALNGPPVTRASVGAEKNTRAVSTVNETLMNTRFWTPRSDTWDPERFFNPVLQRYECPMIACAFIETSPTALSDHCQDFHRPRVFPCPSCLHEYQCIADLITHCEKVSVKCKIKQRRDFAEVISRISGGFLDATTHAVDGKVKFEAVMPARWEDNIRAIR